MPKREFIVIRRKPVVEADVGHPTTEEVSIPSKAKAANRVTAKMLAEIASRTEGCFEPLPPPMERLQIVTADLCPVQASNLDPELKVTYSAATIHGELKPNKKGEDILLLESNDKHYAIILKQGKNEIFIRAENMAQFSEVAMQFFKDAYIKMQMDDIAKSPHAALDFTED
jgi:hypothetical protein